MRRKNSAPVLSTLALALTLLFGVGSVQAAVCKGLESGPCKRDSSCSWVNPYTRKDGVKVGGYCKSKPSKSGKSSDKKSESSKKTETKRKSSKKKTTSKE